jgi:PAS domain S-box-containing protein
MSTRSAEQTDELERTRGALRESEERFRLLMANIPGAVYRRALDPSMTLEFVSDTIEELTGYPADELIGNRAQEFASLIHAEDRSRIAEEVATAVEGDRHYGLAYRIVRADGKAVWVGDRGRAVVGDDDLIWLYGTISDIHERKQLDADRARMEVELRMAQKLEAVGQLAAGIAHEINTPIQFIGDSVQFLKDAFESLDQLLGVYRDECAAGTADPDRVARLERAEGEADLAYLQERVPAACERTLEGVERVAR